MTTHPRERIQPPSVMPRRCTGVWAMRNSPASSGRGHTEAGEEKNLRPIVGASRNRCQPACLRPVIQRNLRPVAAGSV